MLKPTLCQRHSWRPVSVGPRASCWGGAGARRDDHGQQRRRCRRQRRPVHAARGDHRRQHQRCLRSHGRRVRGGAGAADDRWDRVRDPGAGLHTISPATQLDAITEGVLIDGYTQPGSSANTLAIGDNAVPLIEIDGTHAQNVFRIDGPKGGSTLRGSRSRTSWAAWGSRSAPLDSEAQITRSPGTSSGPMPRGPPPRPRTI